MRAMLAERAVHAPAMPGGDAVLKALLDRSETGLVALDRQGRLLVANASALTMLGLPEWSAFTPFEAVLLASRNMPGAERLKLLAAVGNGSAARVRISLADGRVLLVDRAALGDEQALLTLSIAGVPAIPPARIDSLTGLADRRCFQERLEELLAIPGAEIAVLMIDLDRFKSVNDTLGHPAGDALLRLVAQRLRTIVRSADVVSRLGGDEFAVAMPAGPEIAATAARLVAILGRPYLVERNPAVIGASVGIALAPKHGTDAVSLVAAADLALYGAKAAGRGTVRVFDEEMGRRARNRYALTDDLRRAIALQQLELFFQPQMCLRSRRLTGFEALVRWRHPERGTIGPDQFIPLAEEMNLILPIGEWVLWEACRQALSWPHSISVAVNVSPKQLLDRERLPRSISAALASTGLAAERLEIEITETALVNEAEALDVLRSVRALGVRVSMDDFGTGYSSLSQLRRFPFDKLKIDRSFIRDLGSSEEAVAVVRAIAALGRSLGLPTIAEGVETADQEARVRDDGCTEMQGYLISKPVPAGEVAGLIDRLSGNTNKKEGE